MIKNNDIASLWLVFINGGYFRFKGVPHVEHLSSNLRVNWTKIHWKKHYWPMKLSELPHIPASAIFITNIPTYEQIIIKML